MSAPSRIMKHKTALTPSHPEREVKSSSDQKRASKSLARLEQRVRRGCRAPQNYTIGCWRTNENRRELILGSEMWSYLGLDILSGERFINVTLLGDTSTAGGLYVGRKRTLLQIIHWIFDSLSLGCACSHCAPRTLFCKKRPKRRYPSWLKCTPSA